MAYNEFLADRIRQLLNERHVAFEEKHMMGGLAFMVDDKMCVGVVKDNLMARVGEDAYEHCLKQPGAREMNFTGKPMKGFVFVDEEGTDMDDDLDYWIELCLDYNPFAKSSKK